MTPSEIIARHISQVEAKATNAFDRRKYMMFGYYKAVAVYLRKIAREMK